MSSQQYTARWVTEGCLVESVCVCWGGSEGGALDLLEVPGCLSPNVGIKFESVMGEERCLGASV